MARPLELPTWPNDADVAVSLTFDVDAETGWIGYSREYERRMTTLSEGRYGIVRGLPRVLELLEDYGITATFYVPGKTAERYPDAVRGIVERGHEIGHHGHEHLSTHLIDGDAQRRELELGLAALDSVLNVRPGGYRSPGGRLTPETFLGLIELGFDYDSSCLGDDRPYLEEWDGQTLLELPFHWILDDWPHFGWSLDSGAAGPADQTAFLAMWLGEFESALEERRQITYTMHPEVIGRGSRMAALRQLLDTIQERANVCFLTHGELAKLVKATAGAG